MREYREEYREIESKEEVARSAKRRIGIREVSDLLLVVAIAVILVVFAVVVIGGFDVRELPGAVRVTWCTLVAYVIAWAVNWGRQD